MLPLIGYIHSPTSLTNLVQTVEHQLHQWFGFLNSILKTLGLAMQQIEHKYQNLLALRQLQWLLVISWFGSSKLIGKVDGVNGLGELLEHGDQLGVQHGAGYLRHLGHDVVGAGDLELISRPSLGTIGGQVIHLFGQSTTC